MRKIFASMNLPIPRVAQNHIFKTLKEVSFFIPYESNGISVIFNVYIIVAGGIQFSIDNIHAYGVSERNPND